ncbi:acyl-CoA dehydrogenase family protein [Desulfofundulus thermosubterraneus]|uniref:Acyl-CoA dehydrogenase n=1 Tax=Desulfofundulus thermosubterraneus DSM 16057 TaxID=1121432 RepID=A0A1M6GR10_9FIRM|nr:acyl-CoA dehydrogenase family protein [Desulfofundulus thermosubterraneus]SHJ12363.1 Acyl-CoA dehydrogenase [Desulfofundulus thermosubterraneus DSM 16057]
MDFSFTQEQELLQKGVREFAEKVVAPRVQEMEETKNAPVDIYKAMGQNGFFAVDIPKKYGGLEMGALARVIILEEISRVSAAVGMATQVFYLGIAPFLEAASEEQKQKYLPSLAKGEKLATVAVTEASGGSDPTGIVTEAKKEGDNYILNGRKIFITNSHEADIITVVARTSQDPLQFSAFIVEKGMPGFKPGRKENKMGFHGCTTGELIFENCIVPVENLIGKEGDGLKIALKAISETGRCGMAGVALGILESCLEEAVKFANERILGGKPISVHQAIQARIADIRIALESSRLLTYRAAWLKEKGMRCDVEFAIAKYYSTEAAVQCAKKTVDIYGGYGVMMEFAAQRLYRDAQLLIPSAGTSDIQMIVIARDSLKKGKK